MTAGEAGEVHVGRAFAAVPALPAVPAVPAVLALPAERWNDNPFPAENDLIRLGPGGGLGSGRWVRRRVLVQWCRRIPRCAICRARAPGDARRWCWVPWLWRRPSDQVLNVGGCGRERVPGRLRTWPARTPVRTLARGGARSNQRPRLGWQGGHHERRLAPPMKVASPSHSHNQEKHESQDHRSAHGEDGDGDGSAPGCLTGELRPIKCRRSGPEKGSQASLAEQLGAEPADGDRELVEGAGKVLPDHRRHSSGLSGQRRRRPARWPAAGFHRGVRIGRHRDRRHSSRCPVADRGIGKAGILDVGLGMEEVRDQAAARQHHCTQQERDAAADPPPARSVDPGAGRRVMPASGGGTGCSGEPGAPSRISVGSPRCRSVPLPFHCLPTRAGTHGTPSVAKWWASRPVRSWNRVS